MGLVYAYDVDLKGDEAGLGHGVDKIRRSGAIEPCAEVRAIGFHAHLVPVPGFERLARAEGDSLLTLLEEGLRPPGSSALNEEL